MEDLVHKNLEINIKCSRIELKMTETEQSNCINQSAPFVMQLALRLCLCQMPIASITNGFTETLTCSGGVTRQNPPNPPEREARASKKGKRGVVGGKTPLYTRKSAATTWLQRTLGGIMVGMPSLPRFFSSWSVGDTPVGDWGGRPILAAKDYWGRTDLGPFRH